MDILNLIYRDNFSSQLKGDIGEMTVDCLLSQLNNTRYFHLNNVLLPLKNGGTTQIDHMILSPYGIFVIETKNYQGFIFGDENQDYWTQKTYSGTYRFFNPIKQNKIHINVLANLLKLDYKCFHCMILFVGDCKIKTKLPEYVMNCNFFTNNVKLYIESKNNIIISKELFMTIVKNLKNHKIKNNQHTKNQHKQYVKQVQKLCPKCRGVMVERVVKNTGQKFMGCSRFPHCRGTRPLQNKQETEKHINKMAKFFFGI